MKITLVNSFKQLLSDRYMMGLVIALVVLAAGLAVYVGLTIQPSDVQIVTHYTAFGPTNFYRDRWFYLLSFIGFGFLIAILHSFISLKLYRDKGRRFGLVFLWLSVGLLLMSFVIAHSILSVAVL